MTSLSVPDGSLHPSCFEFRPEQVEDGVADMVVTFVRKAKMENWQLDGAMVGMSACSVRLALREATTAGALAGVSRTVVKYLGICIAQGRTFARGRDSRVTAAWMAGI